MVRYLVKETNTATADNPSFAGEVLVIYFGKHDEWVKREGTHYPRENFDRTAYMAEEYGYKRACDAKRSYAYKHPENSTYWNSTVEIVQVEC